MDRKSYKSFQMAVSDLTSLDLVRSNRGHLDLNGIYLENGPHQGKNYY